MDREFRKILHVDMDAFYASVEQLDHPEYRGLPVVVGADPKGGAGRGVVSTCSYEARKFGIHSAMLISQAYRLCPDAVFVFPRFRRYEEISKTVMEILKSFSPEIEQIGIDEAFLDCSASILLFGSAEKIGRTIKDLILEKTGLVASVGIASNKFIAKVASDLEKPDGLVICPEGHEKEFLAPLEVNRLWGAGKKTTALLSEMGIKKIGELAKLREDYLTGKLGKLGAHLWNL